MQRYARAFHCDPLAVARDHRVADLALMRLFYDSAVDDATDD